MNKFIDISLLCSSTTYIFVFVYYRLLIFLNRLFPSKISADFLPDAVKMVFPEPFEIPLYLVLVVLAVLLLIIIYNKLNVINSKYIIIKLILFSIFSFLLIRRIGSFPMTANPFPETIHQPFTILYLILLIFLLTIFFVIIEITIIEKLIKKYKYHHIFYILVIIIISLFTFEPRFPITGNNYSYFFAPILEIIHGRTIFTEISSQYGFLSILFFTILNKFGIYQIYSLPLIIWIFYIIEYYISFLIIYFTSRSAALGLLGLFSIITVNYYSLYHLPITYPQVGPFRWLPLIILIFIFLINKKIDSKKMIFFTSLLSFWIIDVGIAIFLTYLFTLFIFYLTGILSLKKTIKAAGSYIISLITIFTAINLLHIIFGYKIINFFEVFSKTQQYAQAGFGMIPIAPSSYLWLIIFIYFLSIVLFLRNKSHNFIYQFLVFVSNFSFITAVYYVGRSHSHNLLNIATIPILNIFLIMGIKFQQIKTNNIRIFFAFTIFIIFIIFPAYNRIDGITRNIQTIVSLYQQGDIFTSEINMKLEKIYIKYKQLINKYLPEKQILILSTDDTYILYLTNKSSMLNINPQTAIITKQNLNFAMKKVLQICPIKIVVDCEILNICSTYKKLNQDDFNSTLVLTQLKEKCGLEYKPIKCTNHLCITAAIK